jgi:hypothetical protein
METHSGEISPTFHLNLALAGVLWGGVAREVRKGKKIIFKTPKSAILHGKKGKLLGFADEEAGREYPVFK